MSAASSNSTPSVALQEGVFAINKPAGITSSQVVREVKEVFTRSKYFEPWRAQEQKKRQQEGFRQRNRRNKSHKKVEVKVGHGGTLDPAATGCLVIGIGSGTKQLQSFIESRKNYDAVLLFGVATDSYDGEGKILATAPFKHITRDTVAAELDKFRGDIQQRPPIFSALKMDGKALYQYAREGKELPREIAMRPAKVYKLDLTEWLEGGKHDFAWPTNKASDEEIAAGEKLLNLNQSNGQKLAANDKRKRSLSPGSIAPNKEPKINDEGRPEATVSPEQQERAIPESVISSGDSPPAAKLSMDVGSGFYVRSLCHDLGKAVGSLGIMAHLVRTSQGNFELEKNVLAYEDLKAGEDVWKPKIESAFAEWADHVKSSSTKSATTAAPAPESPVHKEAES